ncbi:Protein of unknown function [Terribacillus halophilus]|uniref:DUF3951 domain-containing protein n=1 Tax=Terribacillus halophilus TaxID=361279 RepID=A0A1G6LCA6_9BACI|nr:DUF3951 domain-containing protein [Terribacillus halophilus]SDC40828.1 Protein of unknown function [Terribacillus halophilus]
MLYLLFITLCFSFGVMLLLGISFYKLIRYKAVPDNSYTPFDYITSASRDEFHEEKQETITEAKQGGDV